MFEKCVNAHILRNLYGPGLGFRAWFHDLVMHFLSSNSTSSLFNKQISINQNLTSSNLAYGGFKTQVRPNRTSLLFLLKSSDKNAVIVSIIKKLISLSATSCVLYVLTFPLGM